MKAAFIATNLKGGGAERVMLKIAGDLAARDHSVHLVLLEGLLEHPPPEGATLHTLTARGARASKGWFGKRVAAWRLRRLFRKLSASGAFDLIVSTLPYCDEVVTLAALRPAWFRIANTLSAEIELLRNQSPAKAERRLARYQRLYEGANLIAVSEGVARDLTEALNLARSNVVRIYNAVDPKAIQNLAAASEPELPREPYLIHVGRFVPQKRHDLLLEALRRSELPHRLVLLVNRSDKLDRLIAEKGLAGRITIAGFRRNPYPWIAHAELLILCSDHEGMPNVLLEALACGTRVASTDCPSGPREIMTGELARFLVPRGDVEALANAMRSALGTPRPAAQQLLSRFAPAAMLSGYESLPGLWRARG